MDHIEFEERNRPIAYFISFRCYGTWFHGDKRGSMDRKQHNKFGTPKISERPNLARKELARVNGKSFRLSKAYRLLVRAAIQEVCHMRGYRLLALNVRSNHVHVVVAAFCSPEKVLNAFKAYASRRLRNEGQLAVEQKIWSRHGSTRYLWRESQVTGAIDYVLHCQDWDIPEFF